MIRDTVAKIPSEAFTFVRGDADGFGSSFVIERSVVDALGGLSKVYDNSGAIGFVMISAKTGNEAVFTLSNAKFNSDGEVTCWILSPVFSSYMKPGCEKLQHTVVKVFNT